MRPETENYVRRKSSWGPIEGYRSLLRYCGETVDVVRDLAAVPGIHAVTIGAYDGVHAGHRKIISATQQAAKSHGAKTAVVTFEPHPSFVLRPDKAPKLLTSLDLKLELLAGIGVDTVMVLPFNHARAAETADQFVTQVLVDSLHAKAVVVGDDFQFGRNRQGNLDLLAKLGVLNGFEVSGLPVMGPDQTVKDVSSTAIRAAVASGDVRAAARMLERCHRLRGTVVKGDQRGRTIGFPTANVDVGPEMALPGDGVYAAWFIDTDGTRRPAAVNIGKRPTFYADADRSLIEAHLIGFKGDLYGQLVDVEFVERIRDERAFGGIDELTAQLNQDVESARTVLEH